MRTHSLLHCCKNFAAFFCLPVFLGGISVAAQEGNAYSRPDPEMRLRTPLESSDEAMSHGKNEGILGSLFPNIHGGEAVHFDYEYTGGVFTNARGGAKTRHSTRYVGIFDLGITADTEKLDLWKNGTFYMHSLFSHGENPGRWVGNYTGGEVAAFAYEIPAQVSEYWYEHKFLGESFIVRAGKMDAGVDFFYLDAAENFINASGTCIPTTGIPSAPGNAWGLTSSLKLSSNFCLKFGLFDAGSNANQIWMSELGNVYTAYQIDYHYTLFKYLPGFAYVGAWYNDSPIDNHNGERFSGKSGYSVGFEQMVYRRNMLKSDDLRGLRFFAQISQPRTNRDDELRRFWSAGIRWLGLFESRPDDVFGFGIFQGSFDRVFRANENLRDASETAYELHYHAHLTDSISVQPLVQYTVHPGGQYRNSVAPGVVFQIVF